MGRARSTSQKIAVAKFNTVLGRGRGTGALSASALALIAENEGVAAALRTLGRDRERLLEEPELANTLCDHVFADVYDRARPRLCDWLRGVGVRPQWSLNIMIGAPEDTPEFAHIFPRGHELTDSADILDGEDGRDPRLLGACGLQCQTAILLNRGRWNSLLSSKNPASVRVCVACLEFARDYPETEDRDAEDPLPGPALDAALATWRHENESEVVAALAQGLDFAAVESICLLPALDEFAVGFAARKLSAYPRPNVLRALRSNGAEKTNWRQFSDEQLQNLDVHVALWAKYLEESLRNHVSGARTANNWSRSLMGRVGEHVR